jgi:predicted aspartyl protease
MSRFARAEPTAILVLLALAALSFAACSGEEPRAAQTGTAAPTAPAPTTTEATTTVAVEGSPRRVPLRVVSGPGGVFAFLEVYIRGEGPFAFTVDTGASNSVVDFDVVRKLGLKTIGDPVAVTGITCRGEAGRLRMRRWRAGAIRLPAGEIQAIDMPEPGGGIEIDGLLGSDVLSSFGAITVDYESERLLLGVNA